MTPAARRELGADIDRCQRPGPLFDGAASALSVELLVNKSVDTSFKESGFLVDDFTISIL